jgi:hypothetical protein
VITEPVIIKFVLLLKDAVESAVLSGGLPVRWGQRTLQCRGKSPAPGGGNSLRHALNPAALSIIRDQIKKFQKKC